MITLEDFARSYHHVPIREVNDLLSAENEIARYYEPARLSWLAHCRAAVGAWLVRAGEIVGGFPRADY